MVSILLFCRMTLSKKFTILWDHALRSSSHRSGRRAAFVKIKPFDWIDLRLPWRIGEHLAGITIASRPPAADTLAAEVDILGMVFPFERRGKEPDDMHSSQASITRHFTHQIGFAFALRQAHGKFGDDMPQAVNLLLPLDLADGTAAILNVFLAIENLIDGVWFGPVGIPHVDREHQRVAARIVIEYRLNRGVGNDSSVPKKLAVDSHRRKSRWQSARCHHMADRELRVATVKVAHFA